MRVRTRKFLGTVVLLVFLLFYSLIAMAIGANYFADTPIWLQTLFYLVAGLAWVVPAGVLVRWMQRPDPG